MIIYKLALQHISNLAEKYRIGIMRAALRQTNQRSGLCVTPDLFDHIFRLPRLVLLKLGGRPSQEPKLVK